MMVETISIDERANQNGIHAVSAAPSYLNMCARTGDLYLTSGHTSTARGKLGADLSVDEGAAAAIDAVRKLLSSVLTAHGTLNDLRVVRLLACVNATPYFTEHAKVINAASDLIHEVFGPEHGYHARSALGFASLPNGAAIEIEAIIEVRGAAVTVGTKRLELPTPV